MFPDGGFPEIQHESQLVSLGTYYPWIHRVVLQSLLDNQVVIELGAGERAIDDPCIIRTDVRWTPNIDVVCDAHALPFRAQSADFIFSLAVFEHLRQPFEAAQEVHRVMKDGAYCYHECNFVFAYHGYPHHYFNASIQGMEQIFSGFKALRKGVAPYQMPSFAIQMLLVTYLRHWRNGSSNEQDSFRQKLEALLAEPLIDFDAFFTEEDAAYVAAGSYFFGMRQDSEDSTIIPAVLRDLWDADPKLKQSIPDWRDLGTTNNLLLWAKDDGQRSRPAVKEMIENVETFQKRPGAALRRDAVRSFPRTEPRYGTLWDFPEAAPPRPVSPSAVLTPAAPAGFLTRLRLAWTVLVDRSAT